MSRRELALNPTAKLGIFCDKQALGDDFLCSHAENDYLYARNRITVQRKLHNVAMKIT